MSRSSKQQGDPALKRKGALIGQWRDRVLSKDGPVDPNAKLVALAVAKFINVQSMQTFASAAALAEATGYDERTVRRHLTNLLAAGWLHAESGPSKGFIKPRFLMLGNPRVTAGNTPADTAGKTPGDAAGNMPAEGSGVTAGKTPADETAGMTPGEQRAICPPTAGNDDAHHGQFAPPPRANCPLNSDNPFNTGEPGAKSHRPRGPAQGAERTLSEADLAHKVRQLAAEGLGVDQIAHMLRQYGPTEQDVRAWIGIPPPAVEVA